MSRKKQSRTRGRTAESQPPTLPPPDPFLVELPDRTSALVRDRELIRRNAELLTQAVLNRVVYDDQGA